MKKIFVYSTVIGLSVLQLNSLHAQDLLHVSNGDQLFVKAKETLSVDGLVLIPSTDFVLAGPNNIKLGSAIIYPLSNNITNTIKRVYQFDGMVTLFSGEVSLYYKDAEVLLADEKKLKLVGYDGKTWVPYSTPDITNNTTDNIVTTRNISQISFQELTLGNVGDALYDYRWVSVAAKPGNDAVAINWITENETLSKDYQVQKTTNLKLGWIDRGTPVKARNRLGNNNYNSLDASSSETAYYRIKETGLNGEVSYSPVVIVQGNLSNAFVLYPNPAHGFVNLYNTKGVLVKALKLYDAAGKLLSLFSIGNSNTATYKLDISAIAKGSYLLSIELADGSIVTKPFLKQ